MSEEEFVETNGYKNNGKEKGDAGEVTCAYSGMDKLDEDEGRDCQVCGGSHSVTMDFVHGILVCEDCGAVAPLVDLVPTIGFSEQGQPLGHMVDAKDSGMDVSMLTMKTDAAKRAVKRSREYNPMKRLREILRAQSVQLGLSKPVLEEAELYMEQLSHAVKGTWKRSVLVGAALYIAIRQNRLPLTLLDLTSVTGIRIFTLGKYYCQALQILSMDVPPMDSKILLPKMIQRFMEYIQDVNTRLDSSYTSLCEDAELALGYILQNDAGSVHPLTSVGAAVFMAIEMNNVRMFFQVYSC
jgi:transcription initiation factor TFIIIB Brf1 subunit/transcription initiation factor TFIIB